MPTTARSNLLGATALAVLLATGTGCSSDSGRTGSDSKVLEGLGALADDSSANPVAYLDVAKARELSKGYEEGLGSIGQPGGILSGYQPGPWGEALKVTQIDTSVDTESASRWRGSFDVEGITAELKSNGFQQTGDDETWTKSGSRGMSLRVTKQELSYTYTGTSMAAVNPKNGASLGDKKEYQRVAECLGDVYRADFSALTTAKPVHLTALGQQAATAAKNTEILCLVAKDEKTADRAVAKLRSVVAEEAPRFDGTKVTVEKGDQSVVRAVVPDTGKQRPGRLILSDLELWTAITDSGL
ncbi:hypothetical protein [Streptomyces europaeiscabiei]|uniref:hypothetical protein n=1 Tax=Streptomyces europaeiscabiei TaxID=146819 RepID=UPI002E187F33